MYSPSPSTTRGSGAVHTSTGLIVGIAIAGVAAIILLLFLLYRRQQHKADYRDVRGSDQRELDVLIPGAISAFPNYLPLPREEYQNPNPAEGGVPLTRLLHTPDGIQMEYVGPSGLDSIRPDAGNSPPYGDRSRRTGKRDNLSINLPAASTAPPPLTNSSNPPRETSAQNSSTNESDLRPQLEALRAELDVLRTQHSPPQYSH
jgi:hypothetical protein